MKKAIVFIINKLKNLNKGQGILEYGFILVLIAMALIVAIGSLGGQIVDFFSNTLPNTFP